MKIGEALAEKKRLQARLAKCHELIKKTYYYKGKKPDFSFDKLMKEVDSLEDKILNLKLGLIKTNLEVKVKTSKGIVNLSNLIIILGDIRSRISLLSELYKNDDDRIFRYDDNSEMKPQIPPEQIEKDISELNKLKTEFDGLLQHTNWTVDLK